MLKLLAALAAVCIVTPAFAGQTCDPAELALAMQQNDIAPLGTEPLDDTPIVIQIGQHGGDVVVIFTVDGCPEHQVDGSIAAHVVWHSDSAAPAPAAPPEAPPKPQGGGAEIGI